MFDLSSVDCVPAPDLDYSSSRFISMDTLMTFLFKWGGAVGLVLLGFTYLFSSDALKSDFKHRAAASAYGPAGALTILVACSLPRQYWINMGKYSLLLAMIPSFVLLIYSLIAYPGPRKLHLCLVPFAAFFGFWQFIMSSMIIFGK